MFGQKFFPYSTLQELNLDWILTKVKNILRFVPDDGAVGQILRRTKDGAEWSNEQGGGGAVNSVNGQTGTVVLTASDVGALPDSYTAPVTSVNTKTGAVVLDKTDIGLGNVANVAQYSASNPPPYPVTSVNSKTGAVVLDKSDVGLGNVANVAQYSASNPPPYPVTSVNGKTGAVVLNDYETGTITYARTLGSGVLDQRTCLRVGNVVNIGVRVYNITEQAAGSWFAVPSTFIPLHDCCISGTMEVGGVWYPLFALVHSVSGLIDVNWSSGSTATQVQVYGTYILD